MELIQYIRLFRRWLWLLILAGFVGVSVSFINASRQPLQYETRSLVAIGAYFQSPNPSSGAINIGEQLTSTYAQLIRTQDVLEGALDSIDNPIGPDQLGSLIWTNSIPETSFLEIWITYTDPILAADFANALAEQLIVESPTNLTQDQQRQITLLNQQIDALTEEISDLRENLSNIDLELATEDLTSSRRVELQVERLTLIDQINVASNNVAQFSSTVADLQVRTNSIEIIERARIPSGAASSFSMNSLIMGGITAIVFVGGLIFIYEYFNSTFHSTEEASQILRRPILGSISKYGKNSDSYSEKLLTNLLKTRMPDEFRILRTNLLFSSEIATGIYVVTSATPNEGKTTVVANLASSLAMSGLRVLLIDTDLRKPQIHRVFDLDNSKGLTALLTSNLIASDSQDEQLIWQDEIKQTTKIDNLWILPSGFPVDNPTELLGSTIMKNWVDTIQSHYNFDIILIDTPPILGFPDSAVMSVSLGAKVIPIIRANQTRHDAAKRMIERLDQVQAEIIGIILNQVNPRDESYQDYSYYVDYYTSST
jgi:capsular exopolysaccharide synthesis family protein